MDENDNESYKKRILAILNEPTSSIGRGITPEERDKLLSNHFKTMIKLAKEILEEKPKTVKRKFMSAKNKTRFFIQIDLNDQELNWLKIQIFNNFLDIENWYDPKPKTYDEAEEIARDIGEPLEYYISHEGLSKSIYSDLNFKDVKKIAKLLQIFLIEFNRDDIIKSLGFSIFHSDWDTIENFDYSEHILFALKISKEKCEILNLNDWLANDS